MCTNTTSVRSCQFLWSTSAQLRSHKQIHKGAKCLSQVAAQILNYVFLHLSTFMNWGTICIGRLGWMLSGSNWLTWMCSDNVVRPVYSGVGRVSLFDLQHLSFCILRFLQYIWECSCVYFKYSRLSTYRFRLDSSQFPLQSYIICMHWVIVILHGPLTSLS